MRITERKRFSLLRVCITERKVLFLGTVYHRKKGSGVCITERKVLSVIHTLPQVLSLRRVYRREKGPLPQESVSQRERFSPTGECIAERKVLSLR